MKSTLPETFEYGVHIAFDHSITKESISSNFLDLPLQADSNVHLLQARPVRENQAKESYLLLAETQNVRPSTLPQLCDPFEHVADITSRDNASEILRVFKDTSPRTELLTLEDLLGAGEAKPDAKTRVTLAALLVKPHLHFSGLSSQIGSLDPRNSRFFDSASEASSTSLAEIVSNEDLLLNIYYFASIGKPPQRFSTRTLGAMTRTKLSLDTSIVDLGLFLYQIGCWKNLLGVGGNGKASSERLREQVYANIHELYRNAGLRFTETVQICLQWDSQAASGKIRKHKVVL